MKLKYYLRGLGIGIAVTAAVLMIAGGGKESLTDEEIMERASDLGMVESVTLSSLNNGNSEKEDISEEASDVLSAEIVDSEEAIEEPSGEQISEEISSEIISENESLEVWNEQPGSEIDSEVLNEELPSENVSGENIEEYVIVEVGGGDGSYTVSEKLQAVGMIENARAYDNFLCNNGYDKILQTGRHEIPKDADWNTIADILAGRM